MARGDGEEEEELLRSVALQNARSILLARDRAEEALRAQSEWLRITLASIGDAVISTDAEGRVTFLNGVAESLTGWPQAEAVGRPLTEVFRIIEEGTSRPIEDPALQSLREDTIIGLSGPTTLIARDGTNRPIDDSAAPMRDASGAVLGAVLVFRDITERKQAEARALQAERLAAIGEIVTGLAHESRNALQRGQACLEMLALEVPDRPRARELIARLQRAQDDLSGLYEEVREYAAPIRLQLRDCNLAEVWRDAWTDLEPARQGRVAVLHEVIEVEDLCGRIDAPRMGQVFRNLLENALIACSDPVEIAIRCGPDDLDGRPAMRISVRDDGPGFTAEEGPKVFEAFYTTKTRGTGLGLTICRRIVEAHEGRIISADPPGRGAEFILILPRAACSEQRTPSAEPHPSV